LAGSVEVDDLAGDDCRYAYGQGNPVAGAMPVKKEANRPVLIEKGFTFFIRPPNNFQYHNFSFHWLERGCQVLT
jgi:hypothetical protein